MAVAIEFSLIQWIKKPPMSETQQEKTKNTTPPETSSPLLEEVQAKIEGFFSSWKVKAGIIGTVVVIFTVGLFTLNFFWAHLIANKGMKDWSSHAGANPIECMIKDTNDDAYVSCSAMLRGEVVPLECGSSVFNIGCRVNYGAAAAPPVRLSQPK